MGGGAGTLCMGHVCVGYGPEGSRESEREGHAVYVTVLNTHIKPPETARAVSHPLQVGVTYNVCYIQHQGTPGDPGSAC